MVDHNYLVFCFVSPRLDGGSGSCNTIPHLNLRALATRAGSPGDINVPRAGSPGDINVPRAASPGR